MSNSLTAIISADTSGFKEEVLGARHMLNKWVQESGQAASSIKGATKEQVAAYSNVIKSLEKVASGSMSTSQSQKALAASVAELKIQFANLSDEAKSSDFGKSIASATSEAQSYLKTLGQQIKQVGSEMGNSSGTLKKHLRMMSNELALLTNQYRNMSDAEKSSSSGVALAQKMDAIREKAGDLKDTIGDVEQEIKVMASDTKNMDVFNDLIGVGADGLSLYSSILAKVTGDEGKLKDAIATVMMTQSAANLVTKVANMLQSSSAVMLKIRTIQEKAAATAINIKTASEGKGVVTTKAATVAQAAFNIVAKANPYVLLATAAITAVSAIAYFSNKTKEASEKQNDFNDSITEGVTNYKNAVATNIGDVIGKYEVLKKKWSELKTTQEKNQFLKNNANEFKSLGLNIINVASAENIFVHNSSKVVSALQARAKAAAGYETMVNAYKKYYETMNKADSVKGGKYFEKAKVGSKASLEEIRATGLKGMNFGIDKKATLTNQKQVDAINNYRIQKAQETHKKIEQQATQSLNKITNIVSNDIKAANKELASQNLVKSEGSEVSLEKSKTANTKKTKEQATAYEQLEEKISSLEKKEKDLIAREQDATSVQEELNKALSKKAELDIEIKYGNSDSPEAEIAKLEEKIRSTKMTLNYTSDSTAKDNLQEELSSLESQLEGIKVKLKFDKEEFDKEFNDALKKDDGKVGDFDKELEKPNIFTPPAGTLDSELAELDKLKDKYQESIDKLKELYDLQSKAAASGTSLTKEQTDAIKDQEDAVKENKKAYDEQKKTVEDTGQKVQEYNTTMEAANAAKDTVASVGNVFSNLGSAIGGTTGELVSFIGTSVQGIAQLIPQIAALIAGKEAEAIASGVAGASQAPWFIAIAQIAAIVGTITSIFAGLPKFASGGIISGNSSTGDYNIARVNSGEMILNGTQQSRLFRMLNGSNLISNNIGSGKVEFEIAGSKLKGVLSNYENKKSRI